MSAQTIRQAMYDLLSRGPLDARDLSQELAISEKLVYTHLPHIARSARTRGHVLVIEPAECLSCGYGFKNRQRFTPPGKCPVCRSSHLSQPRYRIE